MLAAAYDYNPIASASGLLSALFDTEFRENARFPRFSGSFCPTFTDSVCIKDSVRIDPCAGSGHILVYMFDVLMQIYEAYGMDTRTAVASIVENNIYGLDIDERATQLAYFAVMMKACQYDRRFLRRGIQPNVYAIVESNHVDSHVLEYFCNGDENLKKAMDTIIEEMYDAKEYGSIITVSPEDWLALYARFDEIENEDMTVFTEDALNLKELVQVAEVLAQKYHVVVTNPPYMNGSGMDDKLLSFVQQHYNNEKADIYACFITKALSWIIPYGFVSLITMETWMFLNSLEKMRRNILNSSTIINMVHMPYLGKGSTCLGINFGTSAYVLCKKEFLEYCAEYLYVRYYECNEDSIPFAFPVENERHCFKKQKIFSSIPSSPVAYWVSNAMSETFSSPRIASKAISDGQTKTGDNNRFLRFVWEVKSYKIGINKKWAFIAKGGNFRRWYGNIEYVIDWSDSARQHYRKDHVARIAPEYIWFREGVSWNHVTSIERFAARYLPSNMLFETAAPSIFFDERKTLIWVIGYLNSVVSEKILKLVNPTMCTNVGDITVQPMIKSEKDELVEFMVVDNIELSKQDWDSYETSWDFARHPLVRQTSTLPAAYTEWEDECVTRFAKLKSNEEELNRIFIDIYGLQDELTPEVEDKDVTVRLADKSRDVRSFISYAVGCMFGRYSLDEAGLIFAGGEWDAAKYKTFPADPDNIIPISDDEYFDDDIVARFVKFVEIVYGEDGLQDNLKFIADALGGKGQPKEVIRNYFLNDFYKDHCKIYQKRPIYWLFDSGKKNGFKCLIYMHRYAPDTIARIRTDYVHEQQARYRTAIADLENRIANATTSERVKLNKELKIRNDQAAELHEYEEKIHHLADQMISIDLDDGVKVNYEKFKDVLARIK